MAHTNAVKQQSETWTVIYFANNGDEYMRTNVLFYKIQEALMDLSREAFEKGTFADRIEMR